MKEGRKRQNKFWPRLERKSKPEIGKEGKAIEGNIELSRGEWPLDLFVAIKLKLNI